MSDSDLDYILAIKYSSNLDEVLRANRSLIIDHEKFLKNTPLRLAYNLDDRELAKKFSDMETKLKQFVLSAQSATSSGGGVLGGVVGKTQAESREIQGLLERTEKIIKGKQKDIRVITEKFQGKDGSIITNVSRDGKEVSRSTRTRDREEQLIKELRSGRFADVQSDLDRAQGAGNATKQLELLRERLVLLQKLRAQYDDIASSAAFKKVESGVQRTAAKIDTISGNVGASLDKQKERDTRLSREKSLLRELTTGRFAEITEGLNRAQGANDTTKQMELLRQRLSLLQRLQAQYDDIANSPAFRKVEGGVQRTQDRVNVLMGRSSSAIEQQKQKQIEQERKASVDDATRQARQQSDLSEKSYKQSRDFLVTERAKVKSATELAAVNQRIADLDVARVTSLERSATAYREIAMQAKAIGNSKEYSRSSTLADNFERQAAALRSSLGGEKNKGFVKAELRALEDELRIAKQLLATQQQTLGVEMKRAQATADMAKRNAAVQAVIDRQKRSLDEFAAKARDIAARANLRGFDSTSNRASDAAFKADLKGDAVLQKSASALDNVGQKAKAATKGVSSIVGTFTQWYLVSGLVTNALSAVGTALQGVIAVDRQFAVLKTIFQGTAEEAQNLKMDVLALATANGRSADEALAAATSFARLGLSRVQINKLVETSLVAANVAEISSADAAEKLTALMQQYKLSVDEVAASLGRLNSISNTQNVTVGQLLSNISLTASVARQAGIALEDLEGIIGVTIASTKATSSEIGNAIKFVLQRLRKPETLEALKLEFDIDLTKANGDLREGTEILRELSRIYPLLTKSEQSRLLDLAAGTRQASRFATVLETFNRAQNVTANAVGDTNSAMRENENITVSLASRLQGLETAWISFATAIGDTGLLDQVSEKVVDLSNLINDLKEVAEGSASSQLDSTGRRKIQVPNNQDRASLDVMADNVFDPTIFDRSSFSKQELETFKKLLPIIDEYRSKLDEANASNNLKESAQAVVDFQEAAKKAGIELRSTYNAAQLLDMSGGDLKRIEQFVGNALPEENKKRQDAELTLLRGRLEQFQRGAANAATQADNLREQIDLGVVDPKKVRSDFESFRNALTDVDGGASIFAKSLVAINTALDQGDYDAVVAEIKKVEGAFKSATPGASEAFESQRNALVALLEQQISESIAKRRELEQAGAQPQAILDAIDATKVLQDRLSDVKKDAQSIELDPLSAARQAKLTQFFDALRSRAEEISKAFSEIPAGENTNTADFQFGRASSQNFVRANAMENALNTTIAQAEREIAQIPADAPNRDDQVRLQQEIISAAKTRLVEEVKISEEQDRQNRLMVQGNRIRDAARDARNQFSVFDAGGGVGANESEKLRDQLGRGTRLIGRLQDMPVSKDTANQAAQSAAVLAAQEANQSRLLTLKQREQQIGVAMKQAAVDLQKAEEERTNQLSKRLALASREEQLTAATLAATIRAGGALTQGEFMGLSQRTRQVADSFTNSNPFAGDDTPRGQYRRAVADLAQELQVARTAISDYTQKIAEQQKIIEREFAPGGRYAPRIAGDPSQPAQGALDGQGRFGAVVLNANGTVMNINLAEGFSKLQGVLTVEIENRINREFERINERIRAVSARTRIDPDISPANAVSPP